MRSGGVLCFRTLGWVLGRTGEACPESMGSQTTFVHVHEPIFVVEACFGVNICFCGPASLGPYQYSRGCEQRQQNPLYPGRHIILTL